ncbi:phytanoyl-CoA dioxygenase family protein [Leptospira yanagawae]|uniref:phytanoyl-CoA dioxygenase family protein n=1 Tax=Leptospira yanagawae TaxID=293069 RepID=UPI001FD03111|nr:phytanoyl-CoA dioxygenase family protein [Leptospira yanagawae]
MEHHIENDGYLLIQNFFDLDSISKIKSILKKANEEWLKKNKDPKLINSAYLTSKQFLQNEEDRNTIFNFIASDQILRICKQIFQNEFYFLNTQIFFNPNDNEKKPYWHRDIQYLGIPEEEQTVRILKDFVWHFRIPLEEDPGLWFVPGSHKRWDHKEEREVRLEIGTHRSDEPLPNQILIPHYPGDLLVFSAHLLHKGEYGKNRFSFDILYTNFPESKEQIKIWEHFPDHTHSKIAEDKIFLFQTD